MTQLQLKYNNKQIEIRKELEVLIQKLDKHQIQQKDNSSNWGYLGDLDYIQENLKNINQFLNI